MIPSGFNSCPTGDKYRNIYLIDPKGTKKKQDERSRQACRPSCLYDQDFPGLFVHGDFLCADLVPNGQFNDIHSVVEASGIQFDHVVAGTEMP